MLNILCLSTDLAAAEAPFLPPDPAQDFYRNSPDALSSMESLGWTANIPDSPEPQQPCCREPAICISITRTWLKSCFLQLQGFPNPLQPLEMGEGQGS